MNQPPQIDPSARRPPAPRRPPPPAPPPPSQVPWVGLTIWGLIIGLAAGVGIQLLHWTRPMLDNPPAPPFLADSPLVLPTPSAAPSALADASAEEPDASSDPSSVPESQSESEPSTTAAATEPTGDRGRVIEPIGLAIRAEPSVEAAYIGGVAYNETVTILELSGDGRWQRVRRDLNGQEGWVKAGNLTDIE